MAMAASTNEEQLEANEKQSMSSIVRLPASRFQIDLLSIVLLNSLENFDDLRLSTDRAGCKFDEIAIVRKLNHVILLQAIHKGSREIITKKDLLPPNPGKGDFGLAKHFCSYQKMKAVREPCDIEEVIICTNARIEVEEKYMNKPRELASNHVLYFDTMCYTFHDGIIPDLKENILKYIRDNPQEKISCEEYDVKDFLDHLELIAYPSGPHLEQLIQQKVSHSGFCKYLDHQEATDFILTEVTKRITQNVDTHLNPSDVYHTVYCRMLEQYDTFFEPSSVSLTDRNKQIVHIVPQENDFLCLLKVHRELQNKDVLFVDLNKDLNIPNRILDMFQDQYTYLVVIHSKESTGNTQGICSKIKSSLSGKPEKRVVLVADKNDEMAKYFKTRSYEMVRASIAFTDFDRDTRRRFLKKHIILQGIKVQLKEVLSISTEDDINDLLSFEILTKLARGETIEIGAEVKPLHLQPASTLAPANGYYIRRSFQRNNESVSEEEMVRLKGTSNENKVILISGSAGMGKSALLRNMTVSIKDNYPHLWVVLVDLSSYSKNLRNLKRRGPNWHITLTDLFDAEADIKFKTAFERNLFSAAKKVLLIDSIYEIGHTYEHIVFSILKDCKKTSSFTKIFIATRPYASEKLERLLNVQSWTLSSLSKENQMDFLEKCWRNDLGQRNNLEGENLLDITLGTPLYTTMLAEICSDVLDLRKLSDNELILPVDLFKMFIARKYQGGDSDELEKQSIRNIFGKHNLSVFSNYSKADSSKVNFIPRIFAEYFAAKFLMKKLEELVNQSTKFKRFLVEELLYWSEYNGVRAFVESFLRTEPSPSSSPKVDQHFNFSVYKERKFVYVLAREGCVNILRYMFRGFNFTDNELTQCWPSAPKIKHFNFVDVPNETGHTALQEAAKGAHLDVIKFLIEHSATIDVRDEFYRTPLHTAARDGRFDVVKYLVEKGADVNSKDEDGSTPLLDAARKCHSDIVRYLVESGKEKGTGPVENRKEYRKEEEKKTVDINVQDEFDATVLHFYAFGNNMEMVEFFLRQETIDVNKKMIGNCTALHAAVYLVNLDMVKLLTEHGADVNSAAITFPLISGFLTQDRSYLDKWKAAVKIRMRGFTALHLAARSGSLDIVEFLMEKGADVNRTVQDGDCRKTVIDVAKESRNLTVVKYLESCINASLVGLDTAHYLTAPGSSRVDMLNYYSPKKCDVTQIFNAKVNCSKPFVAAKEGAEKIKYSLESNLYDRTDHRITYTTKGISDYKLPEDFRFKNKKVNML